MTNQCPSATQWHDLIDDSIGDGNRATLLHHLEHCPPCQDLLKSLADDDIHGRFASLLSQNTQRPPPDAALARLMAEAKAQMEFQTTHGETHTTTELQLDFLKPPENADHLGKLGNYDITEVIGCGGMGLVLKALDARLNRFVAVKVLAPQLAASSTARARFRREGQAAAAVSHDHVIAIHAVDEAEGLPFLVMEYIAGRSLDERISATGPLTLKEILRIGMQTAQGLAAAHAQGLVHRDIKPANILLENGVERVKITDFGLARAVDDIRITRPGVLTGTPEYMSPEQARGERVDARSDLFSLGCVLYAMCTGRPPFREETTVAQVRRICEDTPRPIADINPDLPPWLADIIDKLLAKRPDDRYQSASELADLLEHCLAHVNDPVGNALCGVPPAIVVGTLRVPSPVEWGKVAQRPPAHQTSDLRPLTSISPSPPRPLSHSALTRWLTAALLLLAATLALAETTGLTSLSSTIIRIVRGDGTLVVEIDDPSIQVLLDGDEIAITGAGPKELRLRPGKHELQTVKDGQSAETKQITVTRDGRQVIKVAHELPKRQPSAGPSAHLTWTRAYADDVSRDGRHLAFTDWDTGDLAVHDLLTGQSRRVTNKGTWDQSDEFALSPIFSANGKQLAYHWYSAPGRGMWANELRIIDLEGGAPKVLFSDSKIYAEPLGWTPDGRSILATLSAPGEHQLVMISVGDGSSRVIKSRDSQRRNTGRLRLSPDGRTIAYSRALDSALSSRDIFLIDVETGNDTRLTGYAPDENVLAWAPDGRHLIIDMERHGTRDAWLLTIAGNELQGEPALVKANLGDVDPVGITNAGVFHYALSFGGASIFIADLDLENGAAVASKLASENFAVGDQVIAGDWSPDGEHLAYRARGRGRTELRLASLKGGETRVLQPQLNFQRSTMNWSPSGRSILVTAQQAATRSGIYEVDTATSEVTTVIEPTEDGSYFIGGAQWSADGKGFYYRSKQKQAIVQHFIATKTEREIVSVAAFLFEPSRTFNFELSPDEREIAIYGPDRLSDASVIRVINIGSSESREIVRIESRRSTGVSLHWTADGKSLLFHRRAIEEKDRGLYIVSARGGEPRKIDLPGVDAKTISGVIFHSRSRKLAINAAVPRTYETWALENFLPPEDAPKPAAPTPGAAPKQ